MTWQVITNPDGVHVIPDADLKPHFCNRNCWCTPTDDDEGVLVHHAMDRRELIETGEVKIS